MSGLSYRLTSQDMVRAGRIHLRETAARRFGAVFVVTALLYGAIVWLIAPGEAASELFPLAIAVAAAAVLIAYLIAHFWAVPWSMRRNFALQKAAHDEIEIDWDEEALSFVSTTGHGRFPFADFAFWAENRGDVLLYHSHNLFQYIPGRAFGSETARRELLDAVKRAGVGRR